MKRIVQTAATLFATFRAERRDLMIPICFAILIMIFADRFLLWLVSLISPAAAGTLQECCPGLRPTGVGLLCAVLFLGVGLRPDWKAAWKQSASGRD